MKFARRRQVWALGGLGAALLVGLAMQRSPQTWPIARSVAPRSQTNSATTPVGTDPMVQIEIVPDAVNAAAGKETIQYHAEVQSRLSKNGTMAWTAELVDDVGAIVQSLSTGQGNIGAKSLAKTPGMKANVADGFYALHVRAAVHTADWDDVSEGVQYLAVVSGKMREISFEDWYAQSRAGLAIRTSTNGGAP